MPLAWVDVVKPQASVVFEAAVVVTVVNVPVRRAAGVSP